jgi:hypothetical protein
MPTSSVPTVPAYLIDPPSSFATVETWRQFLKEMETLPQSDPAVAATVREARETLAWKEAEAQGRRKSRP